jgi:Iap family predicted aminopeptidase
VSTTEEQLRKRNAELEAEAAAQAEDFLRKNAKRPATYSAVMTIVEAAVQAIRSHIDERETAVRAEILAAVDAKLSERE